MRAGLAISSIIVAAVVIAAAPPPDTAPSAITRHVVVFDLVSGGHDSSVGRDLSDRVRLRLARHGDWDVIDALTTSELGPAPGIAADVKRVEERMSRLAANVAVWGTASVRADGLAATVKYLDVTDPSNRREWTREFAADGEQAAGLIALEIVEAIRGRDEWTPPERGSEKEPNNFAKPLNVNGSLEQGGAGWEAPDNVAAFIVAGPAERGMVLRIRTDLKREPYLAYRQALSLGQADPSHPPEIPVDVTYNSIAGTDGVHFCSDWIAAAPGQRYWLTADVLCTRGGAPKVFVKGFRDASDSADGMPQRSLAERGLTAESFAAMGERQRRELIAQDAKAHPDRYRREVYRWYLACRNTPGRWTHCAEPFPPRGGLPANVQWLQIQVYAYWPPGEYVFDNVNLYADPRQQAPLPEEPARTPGRPKP